MQIVALGDFGDGLVVGGHAVRRVGFVLSHPLDQSLGSAARVREIVSSLDKLGVECHIFTPFAHTSNWGKRAVFHRFASLVSRTGASDRAYSLLRSSIYRYKLASGILDERILQLLARPLAHFLARALRKVDIDVLQAEQETAALATRIVAEDSGIPWVYDVHNVWFEELAVSGFIDRGGRRYHALKEMQESIIEDSDATVVVSHPMRRFLAETLRTPENRMVVVPPGGR
ncbi:MAG: glycosyltransferase family 4 protein, partial [Candidatus Geothermarchaeales archaeon]